MIFFQKALQEDSRLSENILSALNNRKKEVFAILTGWNQPHLKEQFNKICRKSNIKPCDYALEVIDQYSPESGNLLGAIKYSNTEMTSNILQSAMYQSVKHLALTEITMTSDHFDQIGRIIATCPCLTQITLTKNRMDIEYFDRVVAECHRMSQSNVFLSSSLQFVNLKDNFLTGFILCSLNKLFQFCSKLKVVDLRNCRLDDDLMRKIDPNDKSFFDSIEKLDLRQNLSLTNNCKARIFTLFKKSCDIKL